jgi:hypothetical protein
LARWGQRGHDPSDRQHVEDDDTEHNNDDGATPQIDDDNNAELQIDDGGQGVDRAEGSRAAAAATT